MSRAIIIQNGPRALDVPQRDDVLTAQPPFPARTVFAGFGAILLFLGVMAAWSLSAPLASAVVAPGIVTSESYRKKIQHLEGGIVDQILARDGDTVSSGQELVRLRPVASETEASRLKVQSLETAAIIARLKAEQQSATEITFPPELLGGGPAAQSAMRGQHEVFASRRRLFVESSQIIEQRIARKNQIIAGYEKLLEAALPELEMMEKYLAELEKFYERRRIKRRDMMRLRKDKTRVAAEIVELRTKISSAHEQIEGLKLELARLRSTGAAEVAEALAIQQAKYRELQLKLTQASDVLGRTVIRSPVDGVVVNSTVHTMDGVVQPGQLLMEIVPSSDILVVEGRVRPEDIDEVRAGLPVHVVMTSLSRRNPRPIDGELKTVSADRLVDPHTGKPYYSVRVHLRKASVTAQNLEIVAGMGADIFIKTGERTFFEYLTAPIVRLFTLGMREN